MAIVTIPGALTQAPGPSPGGTPSAAQEAAPAGAFAIYQEGQPPVAAFVQPLSTGDTVEAFYDYRWPAASAYPDGDILRSDVSTLFLFEGPEGLSLVLIHDDRSDGSGGRADVSFSGLPAQGSWVVQDDPAFSSDQYTRERAQWAWHACCTDGGAYRGLDGVLDLTVDASWSSLNAGRIQGWQFLSGDPSDPQRIDLDLDKPVHILGVRG